mmetsp:Transcript_42774/g.35936  ORF Transcript_42774/g.35936 Transcript_42774/m.35936 type:complete len:222 (-) Transcript_42774:766-1431(-)
MSVLIKNLEKSTDLDLIEWNLNVACSTCISLCAMHIKDPVVYALQEFVTRYINSDEIVKVRCAVIVIGALSDGPSDNAFFTLIRNSSQLIIKFLVSSTDTNLKFACGWALSRVCEHAPQSLLNDIESLIKALIISLQTDSRVASQALYSIQTLFIGLSKQTTNTIKDNFKENWYQWLKSSNNFENICNSIMEMYANPQTQNEFQIIGNLGATVGTIVEHAP